MASASDLIRALVGLVLFWIGVYLVSRNLKSKLAWIIFLFLFSLSWYIVFVDVITPLYVNDLAVSTLLYKVTNWTYILPIPLILHLSVLTTKRAHLPVNRVSLWLLYIITLALVIIGSATNLITNTDVILYHSSEYGYFSARGPLFLAIAVIAVWSSLQAVWNFLVGFSKRKTYEKYKFGLAAVGALLYALIGPFLVYIYSYTELYDFSVYVTAPLLIAPVLFWLVSIFFFRLVSDVDEIFNFKEFVYQSAALLIINGIYGVVYLPFASQMNTQAVLLLSVSIYVVTFTHAFYDWLTTFIRDLLYNAGKGFSLITDADVSDLVRNFHAHEKLEVSPLLRFKAVRQRADGGRLVDAARELVKEAINYFKRDDFPRRTKQNLKYQLLKMLVLDEAEEGQILWELGFEGYPMKIMSGESETRKPLFKIESMSDYTATSRNAFIALKKEAIHDLAWRLSYLERLTKSF